MKYKFSLLVRKLGSFVCGTHEPSHLIIGYVVYGLVTDWLTVLPRLCKGFDRLHAQLERKPLRSR
jgi:hypothetical protein